MVCWVSYLYEEEEEDDDEDADFRMDPGSRLPQDLRVPCVCCPGIVIKERADGFPWHQLNSKKQGMSHEIGWSKYSTSVPRKWRFLLW